MHGTGMCKPYTYRRRINHSPWKSLPPFKKWWNSFWKMIFTPTKKMVVREPTGLKNGGWTSRVHVGIYFPIKKPSWVEVGYCPFPLVHSGYWRTIIVATNPPPLGSPPRNKALLRAWGAPVDHPRNKGSSSKLVMMIFPLYPYWKREIHFPRPIIFAIYIELDFVGVRPSYISHTFSSLATPTFPKRNTWQPLGPRLKVKLLVGPTCKITINSKGRLGNKAIT